MLLSVTRRPFAFALAMTSFAGVLAGRERMNLERDERGRLMWAMVVGARVSGQMHGVSRTSFA